MTAVLFLLDVFDTLAEVWLVNRSVSRKDRRYAKRRR